MNKKSNSFNDEIQTNPRLTRREAAQYLNLSVGTLANWAVTGRYELPFFRCGKKALYLKSDLDHWLGQRRKF